MVYNYVFNGSISSVVVYLGFHEGLNGCDQSDQLLGVLVDLEKRTLTGKELQEKNQENHGYWHGKTCDLPFVISKETKQILVLLFSCGLTC